MKIHPSIPFAALTLAALTFPASAGHEVVSKNPAPVAEYEGGRGLLTIQGPSGMFINPTSGTLPAHAFTAQYCFLLPNNSASPVMAHGGMIAYGVTDWFEVGAHIIGFDVDNARDPLGGGPLFRIRLLKDEGMMPQLSVGGYFNFGSVENYNAFLALYKRVPISETGFLRSIGFHGGLRETWNNTPRDASDVPVGYFGMEFQLPLRLYAVGEVSTQDRDSGGGKMPYAFGLQWRAGGINVSAAFTQTGAFNEPSFFFGVGSQLKF